MRAMGSWEWIVFAVGLSVSFVIAGIVILKAIARQTQAKTNERREALQKLNFRFTTKIDAEKSEQLDSVLSIQKLQGYSKKSLASGVYRDHPVQLLNLESIYFNGNIAVQIRQTVGLIPLNQSVPKMIITPKNVLHGLGELFGSKSLSFPTHPDFSRKYTVKGQQLELIEDFMTPQVLEFFEARPGIFWAVSKNTLLYFNSQKELYSFHEIERFLKRGTRLASHLNKS
ncbi:MAG: hypothetical protein H2076_01685 [Planctomycetes bacterium]|nr:hypothetical protein [Planctomycetota bacterium]